MKKIVEKNFNISNRISILTGNIDALITDATSNCVVAINELRGNGFGDDTLDDSLVEEINLIKTKLPMFGPSYIELTFALDMYDCDCGLTYYL